MIEREQAKERKRSFDEQIYTFCDRWETKRNERTQHKTIIIITMVALEDIVSDGHAMERTGCITVMQKRKFDKF